MHCAVICWANRLPFGKPGLTPRKVGAVAWAPALAVLVEKKSRRMELALYCCCRVRLTRTQRERVARQRVAFQLGMHSALIAI